MKRIDRALAVLLVLGAIITAVYWFNYFSAGDVRVLPDYWYSAFENSALLRMDGWRFACLLRASGFGAANALAPSSA